MRTTPFGLCCGIAHSLATRPNAKAAVQAYEAAVSAISGGHPLPKKTLWVRAFWLDAVIGQEQVIQDAMAGFVASINEGGTVPTSAVNSLTVS